MQNIFFLDGEMVPQQNPATLTELPALLRQRYRRELSEINPPLANKEWEQLMPFASVADLQNFYKEKASLSAEFGKLCSVSAGVLSADKFYIKTVTSKDEVEVLTGLTDILENGKLKAHYIAGHGIIDFDVPFFMRRYIVNNMTIPHLLNLMAVKKMWEHPMGDTMKMWAGGVFNYRVSLALLCETLCIPTPKDEITGVDVCDLFYGNGKFAGITDALKKIGVYNAGDVVAAARCWARLKGLEIVIRDNQIFHI